MTPPRLARWLVRRALPGDIRGLTIAADLDEEFEQRASVDARRARAWYWRAALGVSGAYARRRHHSDHQRQTHQGASLMDALMQDARFAVRTLRKSPGFTAAALITLAVGIGASTAIFSVLNAVVLRPLPFHEPSRLAFLAEDDPTGPDGAFFPIALPNYLDWKRELRSFDDLSTFGNATFNLTGDGSAQRLRGLVTNWNFLRLLGVQPILGRDFEPADDVTGVDHRVLISHELWTRRFGADPGVLGRKIVMDGHSHTIIGVVPKGFRFMRAYDVFEPIALRQTQNSGWHDRGNHMSMFGVGRLKEGVSLEAANAEVEAVAKALEKAYPATNANVSGRAEDLARRTVGDLRPTVIALFTAVGFLLLIACVNVTNLQIARGAARQHELSVRAALGGGRARLVRQLIVESVILSLAGGVLGVAFGAGLLKLLLALAPEGMPRLDETSLDGMALAFAFAAVLVAGLVFGVVPALHASRRHGQEALVRASRNAGGAASMRMRRGLIIIETALALVMLTGAGLMMRTMQQLSSVDAGFDLKNLATARLTISNIEWQAPQRRAFFDALEEKVRTIPGVTDSAIAMSLPIEGSNWGSVFLLGDRPTPANNELPSAAFSPVTPGYFTTLRMRVLEGRALLPTDRGENVRSVVVNETFAKKFWPNGGAVGQRLKQGFAHSETPWREIVGVVNDVKLDGVAADTPLQVYTPLAQDTGRTAAIIVRTAIDPEGVLKTLSETVRQMNPDLPVYNVATMESMLSESMARERVTAVIFGVFAAVALLLASVGLYGIVSHGVTERTPEIGVRLALGATPSAIVRLFLKGGLVTALAGIAIGGLGAYWLTGFLEELLFGVEPSDLLAFSGGAGMLFVVALVACYVPAVRAARVSPTVALRGEG
jgi:putative ABC transport system permease protein